MMTQDGQALPRAVKSRRARLARVLALGCGSAVLLLACCVGAPVAYVLSRAAALSQELEAERTAVPADCLRGGDLDAVYQLADPTFRSKYSAADWQRFVGQHPRLSQPDALAGATADTRKVGSTTYRLVRVPLPGGGVLDLVFRVIDGTLRLLGVRSVLEEALPTGLLDAFDRPSPPRRHRRWFHD